MSKPFTCPHCKKSFADGWAQRTHHKAKHGDKKMPDSIKKSALAGDDDESMADRAIAAELDHAMGINNSDYDWMIEPYK